MPTVIIDFRRRNEFMRNNCSYIMLLSVHMKSGYALIKIGNNREYNTVNMNL